MSHYGGYGTRIRFGGRLTAAVRALIIANVAVFLLQLILHFASPDGAALDTFAELFALKPALAIGKLRVWQFITHSFLHDLANLLHIGMNMFLLWMFGGDVESALGRRRFFKLYFAAALAGGIAMIPWYHTFILGASGAVFGVMAMYARLFPYRRLLVWGIFPVRARTLVFVLAGLDLLLAIQGSATGTAHLAHVGGFVVGWFFLPLQRAAQKSRRSRQLGQKMRREEDDAKVRRKVDELLAKVGREGLGSLTKRERDFLSRASKRFRR